MEFFDQMGHKVFLEETPKRIISLVPSQTDLLYYLEVPPIAQTIFCIKPELEFKKATKIGGTKKLHLDKIRALNPDLIIGNKEENNQDQIEILRKEFPVWMSDIYTIENSLEMINAIGEMLDIRKKSEVLVEEISEKLSSIKAQSYSPQSFCYVIWKDPIMAVGKNSFINSMLELVGFTNILTPPSERYPVLNREEILGLKPDVVLLSSEPFPFTSSHIDEFESLFPDSTVKLVDGESCSWYGSYMLNGLNYLQNFRQPLE